MSPRELPEAPLKEGDILAGKYRIEKVLGAGGMGVVVAATHIALGTQVAIKFLLQSTCETPEAVERFVREARAVARIQGEHVARVTDVATLDSGEPYMVMELLRGTDLAAHLKKNRPLAIDSVVEFILQASEAIAEAHAMGLVHRDLKPSNLFLTRRPDGTPLVKVLDFGISKALGTARASLLPGSATAPNASFGSPLYMSPEQISSASQVDRRTDIWALGIVLHELLAGKPPFVRDTLPALYVAITHEHPARLRTLRPDVPESLEATVLRCLEKKLEDRIESVAALARALAPVAPERARLSIERIERLARDQSALATTSDPPSRVDENAPTRLDPAALSPNPRTGSPAWGSTGPRLPRSHLPPWALLAGGLAMATILGLIGFRWFFGDSVSAPAASSSTAVIAPSPPSGTASAEVDAAVSPRPAVSAPASAAVPTAVPGERLPSVAPPTSVKVRPSPVPHGTKKDASTPDRNGLDDRN